MKESLFAIKLLTDNKMKYYILLVSLLQFQYLIVETNATDERDAAFIANNAPSIIAPVLPLPSVRIVGGRNANEGQFPHQVSLRVRGTHICGGSIISATYVVTAAHCLARINNGLLTTTAATALSIRAGTTQVNSGGVVVNVAEVKVHPDFRGFENDIALLRLSTALNLNNRIRVIPLETNTVPANVSVVISGWGLLSSSTRALPTHLQYNSLNSITLEQCRRVLSSVHESVLCLSHRRGNGACQGDSGGPAVYNGRLIGVTNFVIGSCGTTAPDGYANVAYHNQWLRQNSDL